MSVMGLLLLVSAVLAAKLGGLLPEGPKAAQIACFSGVGTDQEKIWFSAKGDAESFEQDGESFHLYDAKNREVLAVTGNCLMRYWYGDEPAPEQQAAEQKPAESPKKKK
jgi:hypothetical protein